MRPRLLTAVVIALAGAVCVCAADEPKKPREKPQYVFRDDPDKDGIGKFYMGRHIAHVMGWQGAGWLERKDRTKEEDPEKLVKSLEVKEGMVVADVGAGSGYHSFLLAPLVGKKGKVIASDIQQEMLDLITKKAKETGVTNVETVKGTATDPKLPASAVDLILMVDVYHEFEFPFEMTEKMVDALKPGGRLVFVEFRLEDEKVPIKLVHKMSERQVIKEMVPFAELEHTKTFKDLPWQHAIFFTKKVKKQ